MTGGSCNRSGGRAYARCKDTSVGFRMSAIRRAEMRFELEAFRAGKDSQCKERLERSRQLFRQHLRLLREIAGSRPIAGPACFSRIGNKAAHFGSKVRLSGVQRPSGGHRKIVFGRIQALLGFELQRGGLLGRQIGNDVRGRKPSGRLNSGCRRRHSDSRPLRSAWCSGKWCRRWRNLEPKVRHGIRKLSRRGRMLRSDRLDQHRRGPGNRGRSSRGASTEQNGCGAQRAKENSGIALHYGNPGLGQGFRHIR